MNLPDIVPNSTPEPDTSLLLRPSIFEGIPHLAAGFSTRRGGVSEAPYTSLNLGSHTGDTIDHVRENRRRLCEALGMTPDQMVTAGQVHGGTVRIVREAGHIPSCDGLVTDAPGLLLCIGAADCAAVLLADPEAGVVGACHAGWRGLVAGIAAQTVKTMAKVGAKPKRIRAFVSPCISADAFEVGDAVADQFDAEYVVHPPGGGKPHVDLKASIVGQLGESGVPEAQVEVSPHCTMDESDLFFSHRAHEGTTGRMMGCIGWTESP
jgi:YfiH family protein